VITSRPVNQECVCVYVGDAAVDVGVAIDVASPQIVELLLLHGADCGKAVEAVSYWGQPLHRALYSHKCPRESYKQMFRLLVQATVCSPQHQHQQQTASPPTSAVRIN